MEPEWRPVRGRTAKVIPHGRGWYVQRLDGPVIVGEGFTYFRSERQMLRFIKEWETTGTPHFPHWRWLSLFCGYCHARRKEARGGS